MKIISVLNNNSVVYKKDNKLVIAIGKGIGFNQKPNSSIDESKIEQEFAEVDEEFEQIYKLYKNISHQYIDIANTIVKNAQQKLKKELKSEIYFNLTSHIQYAVERFFNNIPIINNMFYEVKSYYTTEFEVGLEAIKLINDEFNVNLNEEEAAFIALHLIDAELGHDSNKLMQLTEMIDSILRISKYSLGVEKSKDNYFDYGRFVSHIRQFITNKLYENSAKDYDPNLNDEEFQKPYEFFVDKYPKINNCVIEIQNFIKYKTDYSITQNDKFYLFIHLIKLTKI